MLDRIQFEREARAYVSRGEWEKAISIYRELISTHGDDPNIYNLIGDIYVKMDDLPNALPEYLRAVNLYAEDGLFENGIAVCRKMIRLGLEEGEVYFNLARLYAEISLLNEAMDSMESYLKISKDKKELKREPQKYKRLIGLLASDESLKPKLKNLYIEINQRDNIPRESELDKIFGLIPIESKARDIISKVREQKAEVIPISQGKPAETPPEANYATISIQPEADEKEVQSLLHAINEIKATPPSEIDKDHYELGIKYKALGFYDASVKELQLASTIESQRLPALCALGYCLLEKGDAKLAVNAFKQALEEAPINRGKNRIELQYGLGRACELIGDTDRAIGAFEEVYLHDVSYKDVKERLKKLKQRQSTKGGR